MFNFLLDRWRYRMRGRDISRVVVTRDDWVLVYDRQGRQVPALEGRFDDVVERIVNAGVPRDRWEFRPNSTNPTMRMR